MAGEISIILLSYFVVPVESTNSRSWNLAHRQVTAMECDVANCGREYKTTTRLINTMAVLRNNCKTLSRHVSVDMINVFNFGFSQFIDKNRPRLVQCVEDPYVRHVSTWIIRPHVFDLIEFWNKGLSKIMVTMFSCSDWISARDSSTN